MSGLPKTFHYCSVIHTTVEAMTRFHNAPNALHVLTPPPLIIQIVRDDRESLTQGEVVFRLWFGPLPVLWHARHEPGSIPTSFIDRMLAGPMASWQHEHGFRVVDQVSNSPTKSPLPIKEAGGVSSRAWYSMGCRCGFCSGIATGAPGERWNDKPRAVLTPGYFARLAAYIARARRRCTA